MPQRIRNTFRLPEGDALPGWLAARLADPTPRQMPLENDAASAVLVPVLARPGDATLLLVRKARHLKKHAGQVGFPGGRVDAGDATCDAAALREAREEVGLDPAQVRVLGQLDDERTYVTDFHIRPVVGWVADPPARFAWDGGELDGVLEIGLRELVDERPASWVEFALFGQVWRMPRYEFSGGRVVWGATARILRNLQDRLRGGS
ncbi:MAG: CoA pyrophosphatase [Deltaproteobacteria bacterium]|nr:CoA pyrophosphatase [Deltaproteobacteria bacterium]